MVDSLTSAARFHAVDMSEEDYFSHTSHDRVNGELVESCSWDDRLSVYYSNWNLISENIAAGFGTPQTVVDGWMDGWTAPVIERIFFCPTIGRRGSVISRGMAAIATIGCRSSVGGKMPIRL